MKRKLFTTILITVFSLCTVVAQKINKPKLDSLFQILAEKNMAMGSVAISKNGTILYQNAIGYCYISDNQKQAATSDTRYRIGSISKMFTATMIFQLVEENKIQLSTTLDTYFPDVPNAKQITIANLLNHRSGLHNITDDADYVKYMTQPKTQTEMLAIIVSKPVDFKPNEKAQYSNTNYILLGYIIEKINNQSYARCLHDRITARIGLQNTYVGGKADHTNESYSYHYAGAWQQFPETDMSIPGGAGAIVSTPGDLTRFIEALFSATLVSQHSLDQMKTIVDHYGMGMFESLVYGKKAYGHNGGIDGFGSNLKYFPDDSLAIAYCTNGQVYPLGSILDGILSIYLNKDYTIPTFISKPALILKAEDLEKYLGTYASTQLPLKITITKNKDVLFAQATGQSSFPLQAAEKDKFTFEQAGVVMEFNPQKNEMTLKQGGGVFLFTKEK